LVAADVRDSGQASCTEGGYREIQSGDIKEQYRVTTISTFGGVENLEDSVDSNRSWNNIRENINISA
jgi:hypothetical protein